VAKGHRCRCHRRNLRSWPAVAHVAAHRTARTSLKIAARFLALRQLELAPRFEPAPRFEASPPRAEEFIRPRRKTLRQARAARGYACQQRKTDRPANFAINLAHAF
jgi:hypothetical protein